MKWARRVSAKDSTRSRRQLSLQVEPLEGRALLAASTLSQALVAEDFQVFLHRSTANDPAGLTSWSTQLDRGVSPNTVGLQIANSTESATNFVTTQYQKLLRRAPDPPGLTFWLGQLTSGLTPDQVRAGILGSAEFFANAGSTNPGFLNALYADVLGRSPDTNGNTSWLNTLASGVSRTTVAFGFVTSPEAVRNELMNIAYPGILGRAPDAAGLSSWTAALTGPKPRLTEQQVLVDFIDSPENISRINLAIAVAPTATPDQIAQSLLDPTIFPVT